MYELELDAEGWVTIDDLLDRLRGHRRDWQGLEQSHLLDITDNGTKKRYAIDGPRIRAVYGHSTPGLVQHRAATPPEILYHGTNASTAALILAGGLKPMNRQYVHLSPDKETAQEVGRRKGGKLVLLKVNTPEAITAGLEFYPCNENVWLTGPVAPEFIEE